MSANNDKRDPSNFSFMGRVLGLSGGPLTAPTPVPHSSPVSIAAPPHGVKTQQQPASPVSHPEMVFTPSDVGIWEVNRLSRAGSGKAGLFSSFFGGGASSSAPSGPAKDGAK